MRSIYFIRTLLEFVLYTLQTARIPPSSLALTCCFNTFSLNRSKSERRALFLLMAIFLAHEVCSHLASISSSSNLFRTCFSRADGEILILKSVSHILLKLRALRVTPVHGPSTTAWEKGGDSQGESKYLYVWN